MRKFEEGGGYFKTPADEKKKAMKEIIPNVSENKSESMLAVADSWISFLKADLGDGEAVEYKNVVAETDKFTPEEKEKLMQIVSREYYAHISAQPKEFKENAEKNYAKFHNFVRSFGYFGNAVDLIEFSVAMRKTSRAEQLQNVYRFEGYYPLMLLIEQKANNLKEVLEGVDVDKARMVLDYLVDAVYNMTYEKNLPFPQIETYCQKARKIISVSAGKSENYYVQIKIEQTVSEFNEILKTGVEGIYRQFSVDGIFNEDMERSRSGLHEDYDKDFREITDLAKSEKDKNQLEGESGIMTSANDFSIFYNKKIIEKLKTDVGLDFDALPEEQRLKARLYTLSFLKKIKITELEKFRKYFTSGENEKSAADRIKAFFSLEIDGENGDKLVAIGNSLEQEDAQKVFRKIAELTDLAQKKEDELAMVAYKEKQKILPEGIRTELLRKAHQIILKFSTELESGAQSSEEKVQKLLADLEKSRIDIEIIAALLVATKKSGAEQNVSEIKGVEMETVVEKELMENPVLEEKLKEMYRSSIEHKSQEDQARLLSDFETHKQHDPRFHLVYFDKNNKDQLKKSLENLVGFMRSSAFDGQRELSEGERYLGAMNIDPILQKFYFGENFLREIVEKEFASGAKKLIAHCPENGPSHKIVKLLGFETVAEEGDYRNDDGKIIAKRLRVELVKK